MLLLKSNKFALIKSVTFIKQHMCPYKKCYFSKGEKKVEGEKRGKKMEKEGKRGKMRWKRGEKEGIMGK